MVEDEFHFLFECQLFTDLRIKYLKKYFWNRPNMIKLKEVMSSTNIKVIKNLSTCDIALFIYSYLSYVTSDWRYDANVIHIVTVYCNGRLNLENTKLVI